MPRICHITTAHPPKDTRIFRRECASLAKAGFDVTLIARHESEALENGVHLLPFGVSSKSRIHRFILDTRTAAATALSLRADLYHFHDPELLPAMRDLSRKTSSPVIWDVHEYYAYSIPFNNSLLLRPLSRAAAIAFKLLERDSCRRRFAGIVVVSDTMRNHYLDLHLPIAVVGNYPDLTDFPAANVSKSDRPLLVSIGAQYGPKGAYQIADAYQILRNIINCDLAFWGSFHPPQLKDELKRRTHSKQSPHQSAEIEGPLPWITLMADLLPKAWLGFVLFDTSNPNYRLGLPNRLFEMWAAGVPAVVTDNTEVARLVRQHNAGIVVPNNEPETLAAAILPLLRDPGRLSVLGDNARLAVERFFNWTPSFMNLLSLYGSLGITCNSRDQGVSDGVLCTFK